MIYYGHSLTNSLLRRDWLLKKNWHLVLHDDTGFIHFPTKINETDRLEAGEEAEKPHEVQVFGLLFLNSSVPLL